MPVGFIVGTRPMIDAVTTNDFTRYESGAHAGLGELLAAGDPSIVCIVEPDQLVFCLDSIDDEEVEAVGALRAVLGG